MPRVGRVLMLLSAVAALTLIAASALPAQQGDASAESHGASADGHGAGGEEAGNPIQWAADLALWTLVVFVLLFLVLWRFAWGPLRDALDNRERTIRESLEKAEQARLDAEELVEQHRKKLDLVQDEIREILDEARRDAQHTGQEIVSKAQAEADATRERALRDVERARDQALQAIAEQSAAMITHAAGRVIRASLNESDHRRLIEEALAEFRPDSSN